MNKISLAFAFIIVQFSVFAQDQKTVYVVDSIMDAYMRSGYADLHFMGKGKYDKQGLRNGKWKDYEVRFENFFLIKDDLPTIKMGHYLIYGEGKFVSDLREGEWKQYILEDKSFKKIHFKTEFYVNGKLQGPVSYYFPNGKVAAKSACTNDRINGKFIQYYLDGKESIVSNFLFSKLTGEQTLFYTSGKLRSKRNFVNDTLDGSETNYYENGKIQWSTNYKMGTEHGSYKYYHENGQLWTEKIHVEGLLMSATTFSDTGEQIENGTLENGNGTLKHFQKSGELYLIETYEDGVLVSEERLGEFDW